ncbi:hypothetical protein BDV37DRAFT_267044 [Aspergillus pseudonomiae]|uniref:Uncharacterized protein n=1 Tax=Aspergillus pseudonomiae TaxID=1506151 RepID=A0A5N7CRU2_9EURO|nr:uncharacterized protein BDV37DRAFT_267044 [Aspergillus pseudonomiae]KAE8396962.1 hypothetical protein BDV37DRAFT_267044 [Aspergillus pseudonomiae]
MQRSNSTLVFGWHLASCSASKASKLEPSTYGSLSKTFLCLLSMLRVWTVALVSSTTQCTSLIDFSICLIGSIFMTPCPETTRRSSLAYNAAVAAEYGCQILFLWESA